MKTPCSCSSFRYAKTNVFVLVILALTVALISGLVFASGQTARERFGLTPAQEAAKGTKNVAPSKVLNTHGQGISSLRPERQKVWVPIPEGGIGGVVANDLCEDAIAVTDGATPFSTTGATTDGPIHAGCPGINQDIWFDYTATDSGNLTVSLCGSLYDTTIAVYLDCACPVDDTRLLACVDDTCGLQSEVEVPVVLGLCYKIRVGGFGGEVGDGTLTIGFGPPPGPHPACPNPAHDCCTVGSGGCDDEACCQLICAIDPFCCDTEWDATCAGNALALCATSCGGPVPPENDLCVNAIEIFDGNTAFSTNGALTDGLPHAACTFAGDNQVNQDIWYYYYATQTGNVTISMCSSNYDTKAAFYLGCIDNSTLICPPDDTVLMECNDDSCGLQTEITVPVVSGLCYTLRVGGFGLETGSGVICVGYGDACSGPIACDESNPQSCDVGGPEPGCNDVECCELVCCLDPFCCVTSWDLFCVAQAEDLCGGGTCDTTCPKGSVFKEEGCGSDANGGCNSPTPVFTPIPCNFTVCGNMWADGGTRDTDWYRFSVPEDGTTVEWIVKANFPVTVLLLALNPDCFSVQVLGTGVGTCPTIATTACPLDAGDYVAFVAPAAFDCLPCATGPENDYVATLKCIPPACNPSCRWDLVGQGFGPRDGTVNVDDLIDLIAHWGDCPTE